MSLTVRKKSIFAAVASMLGVLVLAPTASLQAQALNYPALQLPTVSIRDYTASVVASKGSMVMFQWREEINSTMHFGLDAGIYDPSADGADMAFFAAGNVGYDLMRSDGDQPLDLLLTAGVGTAFGNGRTSLRLPVGISLGHRFELDHNMAITPYVHPRLSVDFCSSCSAGGRSQSEVSVNFDVGASFEVSPKMAVRTAILFSGAEQYGSADAISVGITWTPAALNR